MSKDQYLEMMEQMGEEPDWEKCPPDWEDFPSIIGDIMNVYHSMGDRVYPDVGYIGKDFTQLKFFLKHYDIQKHQHDFVINTILWLDSKAIERSQKKIKAEYDRMKRK